MKGIDCVVVTCCVQYMAFCLQCEMLGAVDRVSRFNAPRTLHTAVPRPVPASLRWMSCDPSMWFVTSSRWLFVVWWLSTVSSLPLSSSVRFLNVPLRTPSVLYISHQACQMFCRDCGSCLWEIHDTTTQAVHRAHRQRNIINSHVIRPDRSSATCGPMPECVCFVTLLPSKKEDDWEVSCEEDTEERCRIKN